MSRRKFAGRFSLDMEVWRYPNTSVFSSKANIIPSAVIRRKEILLEFREVFLNETRSYCYHWKKSKRYFLYDSCFYVWIGLLRWCSDLLQLTIFSSDLFDSVWMSRNRFKSAEIALNTLCDFLTDHWKVCECEADNALKKIMKELQY